jgi:hypothetical protein
VKRIAILVAAALAANFAIAQDDADAVLLPSDAQKCVLPASPDRIPEDADREQLMAAKGDVKEFQEKVTAFRACLDEANANPDNTPGNTQAIVESYNYSVEMEERVANRFNEAVRDYKARQAAADG